MMCEKTKTYFTKFRLSANKMQTLLIDLVNYSRTIKGDKIYVDVDLRDYSSLSTNFRQTLKIKMQE
jgi:hypothetical protein